MSKNSTLLVVHSLPCSKGRGGGRRRRNAHTAAACRRRRRHRAPFPHVRPPGPPAAGGRGRDPAPCRRRCLPPDRSRPLTAPALWVAATARAAGAKDGRRPPGVPLAAAGGGSWSYFHPPKCSGGIYGRKGHRQPNILLETQGYMSRTQRTWLLSNINRQKTPRRRAKSRSVSEALCYCHRSAAPANQRPNSPTRLLW